MNPSIELISTLLGTFLLGILFGRIVTIIQTKHALDKLLEDIAKGFKK